MGRRVRSHRLRRRLPRLLLRLFGFARLVLPFAFHLVALLDGLFVARLVVGHDTVPVVLRPRAVGQLIRVGELVVQRIQPLDTPSDDRSGLEQPGRVRVRGMVEHVIHVAGFQKTPGIHDRHLVGDLRDHAEIMGDEQHGKPVFVLQRHQQVEDLRLYRHVERGGRLVGDEQFRMAAQRDRDHHALQHAAGQLMRIRVEDLVGICQLDAFDPSAGLLPRLALVDRMVGRRVHEDRLDDLVTDSAHRIHGVHRLLEDD